MIKYPWMEYKKIGIQSKLATIPEIASIVKIYLNEHIISAQLDSRDT